MGKRGFSIFFIPESGGISSVQLYLSYGIVVSLFLIFLGSLGGVIYFAIVCSVAIIAPCTTYVFC